MSISGNITIIENEINAPITQARDAYQLALATGFVGTLAEWLESLEGADGVAGAAGANGPAGPNSVTSATSSDGTASLSIQNLTLAEALPVESGGTGGNTTSSARTALGLGGSSTVSFRELRANRLTFGRVVAAGGVSVVPSPPDAGFSRLDANSIALGNGETNDATGNLTLANLNASGTITTDGGIAFTGGAASATRTALGLDDGTANLSVATLTAQGATLYSDPDFGSITASAGPDGQPEFTVGSITLRESEGKVRAGFLEATDGLTIDGTSAQATGIALLGSETPSTARTALGLDDGTANLSVAGLEVSTGSIATSQPLALTQTWNNAATTFTGLQVNATDTASNAASLLMDLRVGGVSKFSFGKNGNFQIKSGAANYILQRNLATDFYDNSVGVVLRINGNGANGPFVVGGGAFQLGALGTISWQSGNRVDSGSSDLRLVRDDSGTLAQRNGSNAQTFRLYNTYTSSTNFERLNFRWDSNVAKIGTEKGSASPGGTARDLVLETDGTSRAKFAAGENSMEMLGASSSIILASPDGTRYRVTVANGGALTTTAL